MEATNARAKQGVRRYLELKGCEVLEDGWCHGHDHIDFVAEDEDGTLVFIACETSENEGAGIPEEQPDRKAFERLAAAYLVDNFIEPAEVRYDIVSMLLIGDNRAIIRHHVNALTPLG